MRSFVILTTRKRVIIALVHSVFFFALAVRGWMLPERDASLLWERDLAVTIGGVVYTIVSGILVWLAAISASGKEKLYFAFCSASALTGLLRMVVGETRVPGGASIRVLMLGCAVAVGFMILRGYSQMDSQPELSV